VTGSPSIEPIEFNASPAPTLGVEWELALVDRDTRDLINAADPLFALIAERGLTRHERVHKELLRNTVELVTGICDTVGEAMDDLGATLTQVRALTDELGIDLYGAGTHPFAEWSAQQLTAGSRYAELIERTQWWGRQMLIWGVHVHVGIDHRDKVLPILSSLLKYYPHLLALSASSPMWAGQETGYASNRAMMFQQLPTAGLPFQFLRWEQFEAFVHDQKTTGIIDHLNEIRWDIRPSPHLGTIECGCATASPIAASSPRWSRSPTAWWST
jgi:carboxylate-amine ligase